MWLRCTEDEERQSINDEFCTNCWMANLGPLQIIFSKHIKVLFFFFFAFDTDLFFSNNPSVVNRVEVIPGISDHETVYVEFSLRPDETVYVEFSLRPAKAQTPARKVHIYNKADIASVKDELRRVKEEFTSMEPTSTTQVLSKKFCSTPSDLMN